MYLPYEVRVQLVRSPSPDDESPFIHSSETAKSIVSDLLCSLDREAMVLLLLDNKNQLEGTNLVSLGKQNMALVGLPELFKVVLLSNAPNFMIAHNHLSGDPSPSDDDIRLTKAICGIAAHMGWRMLDHIIYSSKSGLSYSFADDDLISSYSKSATKWF